MHLSPSDVQVGRIVESRLGQYEIVSGIFIWFGEPTIKVKPACERSKAVRAIDEAISMTLKCLAIPHSYDEFNNII